LQRSREAKLAQLKPVGIALGTLLLFALLLSSSLMHPRPPGYLTKPPEGAFRPLDWAALKQADWSPGSPLRVPEEVRALEGKPVRIRGFLRRSAAAPAGQLTLCEQTVSPAVNRPPTLNSFVELDLRGDRELPPYTGGVEAYGLFHVARGVPTDRNVYSMDDVVLVAF
jgi:hypothetical protein